MTALRSILAALLVGLVAVSSARADDAQAAQATIRQQLEAFLAGDDDAAYALAAPNIRRMFPTRDVFMSMVRNGYPPVHKPRNYAFGTSQVLGPGRIMQQVLVVGPDGKDYEAVYTLELQPDGIFRITGVSLRAAMSLST